MTIHEKITSYQKNRLALKQEANQIKKELHTYFTDQTIPLIERWETFVNTDEDFKEHKTSFISASSDGLKYVIKYYFNDEGRGKHIFTKDFLEECAYDGKFFPELFANYEKPLPITEALKLLQQALEEILSKNLGSFVYDW